MRALVRLAACLCLGASLWVAPGCVVVKPHRHGPPHVPPGHAKKVVHHVHGHGCGHVHRNGTWVAIGVRVD